jgi:hypothetical protein
LRLSAAGGRDGVAAGLAGWTAAQAWDRHFPGNPPSLPTKEVMPLEQFLLNVLAGVVVALIIRWFDRK